MELNYVNWKQKDWANQQRNMLVQGKQMKKGFSYY